MRVIFMGSDNFSVPTLQLLSKHHDVILVVTQPDKPQGRGMKETPNPVKREAELLGLPIAQPTRLKDPAITAQLTALSPDVGAVAAYGKIIPRDILYLPRFGCINVHGSILPEYRGAAPIERAIINGETTTGITTFFMNEGLDTGDVILTREATIGPDETGGEVRDRMAILGADLLIETLALLEAGKAPRIPQDRAAGTSTYSPTIKNDETWIDWSQDARQVANKIRAFFPNPGTQTRYRGQVLKLKRARAVPDGVSGVPGSVLGVLKNDGIQVACGQGACVLEEVQPAGKKWMSAWSFAQGRRPEAGEMMGEAERLPAEE